MIYLQLFAAFFHTGLFAVGGGLATMPFLYHMADNTGWFTYEQLANMIAVSESARFSIEQVLRHRYFDSLRNKQ